MRENSNIFKLALLFAIFIAASPSLVHCQVDDAKTMVKTADDLMRGDTSHGHYRMTVTTPDWQRTLELDAYSSGRDKTFIRILSPAKEAGITTLRIDMNMWNYLPKVERTIKIPPSMMLQSWMGSDFSNDDLVKESSIVNDYIHTIVSEEKSGGFDTVKINLTPKPDAAVTWGKLLYWVTKEGYIPVREEFYDEHGKLIKTLEYSQVKAMNDRSIPTVWKMTSSIHPGNVTVIEVQDAVFNEPIDDGTFSMSNLKSNL